MAYLFILRTTRYLGIDLSLKASAPRAPPVFSCTQQTKVCTKHRSLSDGERTDSKQGVYSWPQLDAHPDANHRAKLFSSHRNARVITSFPRSGEPTANLRTTERDHKKVRVRNHLQQLSKLQKLHSSPVRKRKVKPTRPQSVSTQAWACGG